MHQVGTTDVASRDVESMWTEVERNPKSYLGKDETLCGIMVPWFCRDNNMIAVVARDQPTSSASFALQVEELNDTTVVMSYR